jgi:hypothetical protein
MIGLSFLIRLLMIAFYVGIFLIILYVLIFGITWMVRLFVDGVGATVGDHTTWLRSKLPKVTFRKRKRRKM